MSSYLLGVKKRFCYFLGSSASKIYIGSFCGDNILFYNWYVLGVKKFQATPTKQDPGTFFGVKMSDEHPVLSVRESPPSPGYSQKTCKKDCSDAVPGVKCKVRVKCRLQTRVYIYISCYFHYRVLTVTTLFRLTAVPEYHSGWTEYHSG